jgi:cystathionine beta-synthase
VVGLVDESDLLRAVVDDPAAFARPVREVMSTRLVTVEVSSPAHALLPMLDEGLVPIVCEGDEFVGLVTRVDLLDGLRRDARRRDAPRHDADGAAVSS